MTKTVEETNVPAVQTTGGVALPSYLQGQTKQKVGDYDRSDLIIPRIKLLQAISPEVAEDKLEGAEAGIFWHTILGIPLGDKLRATPILFRKSQVLWSPRNDERGVLARASDGKNWDPGFENLEFEVKPKGSPRAIKYLTKGNVAESGLAEFGSSIPGDPNSAPALALTYQWLWYLHDYPDASPAIIINTRSSVKKSRLLISQLDLSPVSSFYRQFIIGTTNEKGAEGPYKGYSYQADGYVPEDVAPKMEAIYDKFKEAEWAANDDTPEAEAGGDDGSGGVAKSGAEPTDF